LNIVIFNKPIVNKSLLIKDNNKNITGWTAFGFIVIHFALIIAYALPTDISGDRVKRIAGAYVSPIFEQSWSMFAPCPVINGHVEIMYFFENDSTDWTNPVINAQKKHAFFRGTYHGELVLAESNLMYWIVTDLDAMEIDLNHPFPSDRTNEYQKRYSFNMIRNYIWGNAIYHYDDNVKKARVKCLIENVALNSYAEIELPQFNW